MTSVSLDRNHKPSWTRKMVSVKYELLQNKGLGADQRAVSNCDIFSPLVSPFEIPVEELEDRVFVKCNTSITWVEGTVGTLLTNNTRLDLGKRILDPRGIYRCNGTDIYKDKESTVQVHYRSMCFLNLLGWNGWGFWT